MLSRPAHKSEAQRQRTTQEAPPTVIEFDALHRERIQRLEDRHDSRLSMMAFGASFRICFSQLRSRRRRRAVERRFVPDVLGEMVARRLAAMCPQARGGRFLRSSHTVGPDLGQVGHYAFHVFIGFPLNAWTAGARMHPPAGVQSCRFGCVFRAQRVEARCALREAPAPALVGLWHGKHAEL